MNKYIILIVAVVLAFIGGRWTKKYKEIVRQVRHSDTVEHYTTLTGTPLTITYPMNTLVPVEIHDTFHSVEYIAAKATFTSRDTLKSDSLFVAILDSGNCDGIINRHAEWGGKIKERTITNTVTNYIKDKRPLFQLDAGIVGNKIGFGPALQLQVKNKYIVGYSYLNNQHNISLLFKMR